MNVVTWSDPSFADVADLVRETAGLVFPPPRHGEVEAATRKVMARIGARDVRDFLQRARDEADLLDNLISELTIGETYFFRDPDHFAFIRDDVVPEIRRLRGMVHGMRAWSAGCATGEEAYSLAILFEELGLGGQARIVATDVSQKHLGKARHGVYGAWSLRGPGASLAAGYLRPTGNRFRVSERFRQRVEFAYLNLAQDTYPALATGIWGMDLVLCRNVLLYFDPRTTVAVARRLYACLAPGGYLIAGPSDPLLGEYAPFETRATPAGVVYRKTADEIRPTAFSSGGPASMPGDAAPRPAGLSAVRHRADEDIRPVVEPRNAAARVDSARTAVAADGLTDEQGCVRLLRTLADRGDVTEAAARAAEVVARYPTSEEIGFLHAIFLMNLERYDEAARALKRVLYLNRSLIVAQFALGSLWERLGKLDEAARAYRNARRCAELRPADELVPFADGERAGRVVDAVAARMVTLNAQREATQ